MRIAVNVNNRQLEVYVNPDLGGCMASVSVFEVVRPKWKIFRTRFIDSQSFWISDYETIDEGARKAIDDILAKEQKQKENCEKWKNFSETY